MASLFWPVRACGPLRQPFTRGHAGLRRVSQFAERLLLALPNQLWEKFHHPTDDLLGRSRFVSAGDYLRYVV